MRTRLRDLELFVAEVASTFADKSDDDLRADAASYFPSVPTKWLRQILKARQLVPNYRKRRP